MTLDTIDAWDAGIRFEVALEMLGQSKQPFMSVIAEEKAKPIPSAVLIKYCEMRLDAIDEIQDELDPKDTETVNRVLELDDMRNLFQTRLRA